MTTSQTDASRQLRLTAALAEGQIADDMLLIHNAAVDYGHDEMAADYLAKYDNMIGYLNDDAHLDAKIAGVTITDAPAPTDRCPNHGYYAKGHCGIC